MRQIGSEVVTKSSTTATTNCSEASTCSTASCSATTSTSSASGVVVVEHFAIQKRSAVAGLSFLSILSNWGIKQFCWVLSVFNFSFDWLYPLYDENRCIVASEDDDPLKRIQDEINEVARRERELREKTQRQQQQQLKMDDSSPKSPQNGDDSSNNASPTFHSLINHSTMNGSLNHSNNSGNNNDFKSTATTKSDSITTNLSLSPIITEAKDTTLDSEHHSDDSGFSASSSPIPTNVKKYIRTNNYNVINPTPPPQLINNRPSLISMNKSFSNTKTKSNGQTTPNGFTSSRPSVMLFPPIRRVTTGPAHKGLMQRFIATRGKVSLPNGNSANSFNGGMNGKLDSPLSPIDHFNHSNRHSVFLSPPASITMTPPIIERDADGKPLRPGYIPVEEKIQKELKDLKNRESELKRIRRLKSRQSQPDLLESIDNEFAESEDDSDVEHCYPPGKLRAVKSISELCDSMNSSSLSPTRTTPSPNFDRNRHQTESLRPAVSLAQLCELNNDEDAPSSHELIAKWESLIQQNA